MGAQSEGPGLQNIDPDVLERTRWSTRYDCDSRMVIDSHENMDMGLQEVEKGPLGLAHSQSSCREGMEKGLDSEQSRKAQRRHK